MITLKLKRVSLKDHLHQLHREGSLESDGRFTIDVERALRLLRESSVVDPRLYVLCLTKCAAAAGADQLEVVVRPASIRLKFSPQVQTSATDLKKVLAMATGVPGPPHLAHFARAVALGLGQARSFEYRCGGGRLRIDSQCFQVSEGGATGHTLIKACWPQKQPFSKGLAILKDRLTSSASRVDELRLLERFCSHFPGTMKVNGRLLCPTFGKPPGLSAKGLLEPGYHLVSGVIMCQEQPGCLAHEARVFVRRKSGWMTTIVTRDDPTCRYRIKGDWRDPKVGRERSFLSLSGPCLAKIAIRLGLESMGRVTLVKDGVMIEQFEYEFGVPGVEALVACPGLKLDLSGFQAVRDRSFERMIEVVKRIAGELFASLRTQKVVPALEYNGMLVSDPRLLEAASHYLAAELNLTLLT